MPRRLGSVPKSSLIFANSSLAITSDSRAKAAFLTGVIDGEESVQVLEIAARHPDPIVRVAAAASAKHLTHLTPALATTFLEDTDPGVRKWGLRTIEATYPEGVRQKVEEIMQYDTEVGLREMARKVIDRIK